MTDALSLDGSRRQKYGNETGATKVAVRLKAKGQFGRRCLREEWRTHFGTIQKWWAAIRRGVDRV